MEGLRGTSHPLEIPPILESIFKNLRVSDLKACRQVNRLWNEEATKYMRSVVTVNFNGAESKIRRFRELVQSELSSFETLPFVHSYELSYVRIDHPEFWEFCGSSVKSLKLSHIKFESADTFRHVIFQLCPNLENLVLDNVTMAGSVNEDERSEDDQEDEEEESLVWIQPRHPPNFNLKRLQFYGCIKLGEVSFLELFSYFPALQEVHFVLVEDVSKVFRSLATCREHEPRSWNIKNLSFELSNVRKPESDRQFLLDESLSLEHLEVREVDKIEDASVVRKILSANAATLKSLRIQGEKAAEVFDSPFDTMLEKVVEFSLEWAHIESLRFLRYLPNLKKLEISYCTFSPEPDSREELSNHWIASSCTDLTISYSGCEGRAESLFPLFRRIPNVEKLGVYQCTNDLFAGICDIFPKFGQPGTPGGWGWRLWHVWAR